MSGATTELNLATAVDSDDNADYLTLSLANSLRTVDGLFNNVTGHTHGGAHQGGPIASIPAGSIPDGSITSAKIADGTIATADLANASVTNAKLGSDTARLNLLANGGFEIWQRGNGPFTVHAAYSADRWFLSIGGGTLSISRDTTNVATPDSIACAVVTSTVSGAGLQNIFQTMESPNLRGRTVTLSVAVRTSTANAVRIGINNGAAYVYSAYHSGGGVYQTLTVTATLAAGASGAGLITIAIDASCTAYLDNAMLVVGSQYADYAPLHPADDLARCLRYYEIIGEGAQAFAYQGYCAAASAFSTPTFYKARKAVTPTATKTGTWGVVNCAQPTLGPASVEMLYVTAIATALGATQFYNNTVPAITLEANP